MVLFPAPSPSWSGTRWQMEIVPIVPVGWHLTGKRGEGEGSGHAFGESVRRRIKREKERVKGTKRDERQEALSMQRDLRQRRGKKERRGRRDGVVFRSFALSFFLSLGFFPFHKLLRVSFLGGLCVCLLLFLRLLKSLSLRVRFNGPTKTLYFGALVNSRRLERGGEIERGERRRKGD